jgi:hypothetical protein
MRKNIHRIKLMVLFVILFIVQNSFAQTTTACWKSFASGELFTLGITSNGQLWSWGFNNFAQLGLGTQGNTANPNKAQIGTATDWKEVEAGSEYGMAIKENGTLWGWGANFSGMLGDGTGETRKSPVQIGADANWSKISAGVVHTLALKSDGTLWAWGRNTEGQIGDGTFTIRAVPTQIGADNDWTEISAGERHSIAIKTNGSLWAWGAYDNGQLGLGNTSFSKINVPTQVGTSSDWKIISAGRNFNLAIKNDGTLWSWGQNDFGQLGNGFSFGGSNVVLQIGTDADWASIAAGDIHSMALKTNGTRWAWGSNGNGSSSSGSAGALGDTTKTDKNIPTQIGTDTDWEKPQAGEYFSFCLKKDGTLWSNGRNTAGELGDGTQTIRLFPILVSCPIILTNIGFKDEIPGLKIYPNPVNDILLIRNSDNLSIRKISVFDFSGKLIITVNGQTDRINLEGVAKGIYVLQIVSEGKSYKKKIIKR